jgi:hypothetical protein
MLLHPRHRGTVPIFMDPHQTERVQLDGPRSAIGAIEHAAARTGRTWNHNLPTSWVSVSAITPRTSTMGAAWRTGAPC